jgi:hypothetical protein
MFFNFIFYVNNFEISEIIISPRARKIIASIINSIFIL